MASVTSLDGIVVTGAAPPQKIAQTRPDDLRSSLSHLLPVGFAWPRDPASVQQKTIAALADFLTNATNWSEQQFLQAMPHLTCTRLEEWEAALGLPDPCNGDEITDFNFRRRAVLSKLSAATQLKYDDSSPAAAGSIERILAAAGYIVQVEPLLPFRVGRNRVGHRLGTLNKLGIRVLSTLNCGPFRVGQNRVGQRLNICDLWPLECLLRRILPARLEWEITLEPLDEAYFRAGANNAGDRLLKRIGAD